MTTSIRFHDYNIIHFFREFVKGVKEIFLNFSAALDNNLKMNYN